MGHDGLVSLPTPIPFAESQRSTVGIEWELALVDADSGDLRQVAQTVLDAVAPESGREHPLIRQELLLNTVEVVSSVCRTVGQAGADLERAIDEIRRVTDPLRVELMCAGTHPFARWTHQKVTDKERYQTLIDRTQWWGRQMLIYGVHVHVGIEDRDKVLPISAAMLSYYGHLQALSASSPFWGGKETGYASNRALMFQQLPTAGLPFHFQKWTEFEAYVARHAHDRRHRRVRRDPLGPAAVTEVRHAGGARLRRHPEHGGAAQHLGPDALPGRALLVRARRRPHAAEHPALVRPGEQVALGPLRHGLDPHPRRARRGGAGHDRPRTPAHRVSSRSPSGSGASTSSAASTTSCRAARRTSASARWRRRNDGQIDAVVASLVEEMRAGRPLP